MFTKQRKYFVRAIAWFSIRFFVALAGLIPVRLNYIFGAYLGTAAYYLLSRHRRIAQESLLTAFPEKSDSERKRLALKYFQYMPQWSFELLRFSRDSALLRDIELEGLENLKAALAKGKGVILISAHIGNFPLISYKLTKLGYQQNVMVRPMRDNKAEEYIHALRQASGVKSIFSLPRRECVVNTLKALRANETVNILMDQNFGTGGVWVNFFGRLAATPIGAIIFALRSRAAVIPSYIVCEDKGKHRIIIEPEVSMAQSESNEETILLNTAKLTKIIESWIRKYPDQWSWIHRRWKSRPTEQILSQEFLVEK